MADNFLEKRMADYLSGRLSRMSQRPYCNQGSTNAKCALVADGLSPHGRQMVKKLRSEGYRVSFLSRDYTKGNLFAQQTGAQFIPIFDSIDDARKKALSLRKITAFDSEYLDL